MEWIKTCWKSTPRKASWIWRPLWPNSETEFPKYAVPKDVYNALADTKKKLETDLQARDQQLEELKKSAGSAEELKKQIEQLQADNKKKDEEYQAQLKDLTLTNAIKLAVAGKVHDEDRVAGLIDKEKLVSDGEGLSVWKTSSRACRNRKPSSSSRRTETKSRASSPRLEVMARELTRRLMKCWHKSLETCQPEVANKSKTRRDEACITM